MTIDFKKVDALRQHMLLSKEDVCAYLDVSRETYYKYLDGRSYPKPKREAKLKEKMRGLLFLVKEKNWPWPEVIAAPQKERYKLLQEALKENNEPDDRLSQEDASG